MVDPRDGDTPTPAPIAPAYAVDARLAGERLEITLSGRSDRHNADAIARDVLALVERHRPRHVLVDVQALAGRLSPGATYMHVWSFPPKAPHRPTAVIDRPEYDAFDSFYYLAAANAGYEIHFFHDRAAALAWLATRP